MMAGKFFPLVCFLTVVFSLVGCASSSSNPAPAAPAIAPNAAYVGSGQSMQFTTTIASGSSGVTWAVSSSGSSTPTGAIDSQGNFTAPTVTENTTVTVTATSMKDPTVSASATVFVIAPATVAATANPQVALYTISVPDGLSAFIQFSTDTSYRLSTWSVAAPSGGGAVPVLVAGMK